MTESLVRIDLLPNRRLFDVRPLQQLVTTQFLHSPHSARASDRGLGFFHRQPSISLSASRSLFDDQLDSPLTLHWSRVYTLAGSRATRLIDRYDPENQKNNILTQSPWYVVTGCTIVPSTHGLFIVKLPLESKL